MGFEWKSIDVTPYKKWIRVPMPGFARTEVQTYMKSDEKADKHEEKPEVCFVEDHDRYCTNMDEHIHKVFLKVIFLIHHIQYHFDFQYY